MSFSAFLKEDPIFTLSAPEISSFVNEHTQPGQSDKEKAIGLYLAVRDGIQYDPFHISLENGSYSCKDTLGRKSGHCIDKAVFLITCLRSIQIPSRIGLARVTNHIGTSRLEQILKTNVLVPHGYVELYLNEKWVKCTPAFNATLCSKLGLEPLEFNGETDSMFQQYDSSMNKSMEYLEDLGSFATLPLQKIKSWMQDEYPHMFDKEGKWLSEKLS